jgi:hypothetical protein
MAIITAQYQDWRQNLANALAANNPLAANPSYGGVLSLFKQLSADSAQGIALSVVRQAATTARFARLIGGNSPIAGNPSDAQVSDFITQLAVDYASAVAPSAAAYSTFQQCLANLLSTNIPGIAALSRAELVGWFSAYAQTPTSILGSAPAWWLDGSAGTLVDAGAGLCSQWTDSSGSGVNFTFAGAARPAIITGGLNSKATLRFSTTNYGGNAGFATPAPGTTPSYWFAIAKEITIQAPGVLCSRGASANTYTEAGGKLVDTNPSGVGFSNVLTANTWYRFEWIESNQASDYVQNNGGGSATGNAGNTAGVGIYLNATSAGAFPGNWEIAEIFQWFGDPSAPQRSQLALYSLAKWGV